jgi:hypothetical protein
MPSLEKIRKTQWCDDFERLMRNRLTMGAFRYGLFDKRKTSKMDLIGDAERRIRKYRKEGNMECLVDATNLLLLEFACGGHPKCHFKSTDDGDHVPTKRERE